MDGWRDGWMDGWMDGYFKKRRGETFIIVLYFIFIK